MSPLDSEAHASNEPTPDPVRQRGLPGGVSAALIVGAVVIVAGFALVGQGGQDPASSPATVAQASAGDRGTPAPTRRRTPTPVTPAPATPRPPPGEPQPSVRADEVRPTSYTPLPDFARALPGDPGGEPMPLGVVTQLPDSDRLDFLNEVCSEFCFRDANWFDPEDPLQGTGSWIAGRPFHVREGFRNDGPDPLPAGYDVVLYVTQLAGPGEALLDAPTYRYTSDYVLRGTADRCGPTYRAQTGPVTCEWFVHDFPYGLGEGRFAIWAMWEAPCGAWIDLGLASDCEDPDRVVSLFSSGFDAPYEPSAPIYGEPLSQEPRPTPGVP